MGGIRFVIVSVLSCLFLIGCGGSINRNNEERENMLYVSAQSEAVIHGYDLEEDHSDPPSGGFSTWPIYRYFTEGVITDMVISADRKWVLAVNDLGKVECFTSQRTGRLNRFPTITLSEGNAIAIALAPNSSSFYVSNDTGKVFHYQIAGDETMALIGSSVAGPASASRMLVRPDGSALAIIDHSSSKIWQYTIGNDGSLSPMSPATIDVSGGPSEAVWNAASSRLFVSCEDSDQVALFTVAGAGQLVEQTRLNGPNKPGAPVLDIAELYLLVPSQDGDGEIWRYQAGPSFTALTPPRETGHQTQVNAILNPYGFFFVLNRGSDSYSAYRINEDAVLTLMGTDSLDLNPGRAVFRVNP